MASTIDLLPTVSISLTGIRKGLLASLLVASLLVSAAEAKYSGGSGSQADPYLISSAEDLDSLGATPADWDKHFRLVRDIDLAGYDQTNFHPIGEATISGSPGNRPFTGVFDGNDRTISNFRYRHTGQEYVGLFRCVSVGRIEDLTLVNARIIGGEAGTGSLVGYLAGGVVFNCHVRAADVSGGYQTGGLVGCAEGGVVKCSSYGRVTGVRYVGGLIGHVSGGVRVDESFSKAVVSGDELVGGLVGGVSNQDSIISSCYAGGRVNGGSNVGGLVGLVGQGLVFQCYSTGDVEGQSSAGGLTGGILAQGSVSGSYWDVETSGQATSRMAMGKTTAEMQTQSTYAGWNFGLTWAICEGTNYPILRWQISVADLRCPDGVNATDFAWFAMEWRRDDCSAANSDCNWTDFDQSGSVDFRDLAVLVDDWLVGVE